MSESFKNTSLKYEARKTHFVTISAQAAQKNAAGNFDFEKSIKRLVNYSIFGHLEAGARMERFFLRHEIRHFNQWQAFITWSVPHKWTKIKT